MTPQPLSKWVLPHQELEFADEFVMATAGKIGRDARFDRGKAFLFEAGRLGSEAGVPGHPSQGLAPPQRHRPSEQLPGALDTTVAQCFVTVSNQGPEAVHVDLVTAYQQAVPHRLGYDALRAQGLAQIPHIRLERLSCSTRGFLTPQRRDKKLSGNGGAAGQRQRRNQGAFLSRAERDGAAIVLADLDRAQQANLHAERVPLIAP
jgi:hypothetical protein